MWTKYLKSGETITEPESWSRTDLDNIIAVNLQHEHILIEFNGAGQYWQSDTFVGNFFPGISGASLIKRRISRYIDKPTLTQVLTTDNKLTVNFNIEHSDQTLPGLYLLSEESWAVGEIDTLTKKISFYFSKDRI